MDMEYMEYMAYMEYMIYIYIWNIWNIWIHPLVVCYSFLLKPWPIEIVDLPTKDCDVLVRYVAGALKKMFLGAPGVLFSSHCSWSRCPFRNATLNMRKVWGVLLGHGMTWILYHLYPYIPIYKPICHIILYILFIYIYIRNIWISQYPR